MRLMHYVFVLVVLASCVARQPEQKKGKFSPKWDKSYSGVYRATINEPSDFNLLSASNKEPRKEVINRMEDAQIPIDQSAIETYTNNGKTYLRFPLDKEEQIYGLGLNFKTVQQRGRIMRLHMDHYGGKDNGRTHAPVPFFISSKGYGVFINAARYIDVYVGTGVSRDSENPPVVRDRNTDRKWSAQPYSDNLEFVVPEEGVELVMFTGKTMMDVVRRFNLYCGGGIIPPKWGLGFWQRTPTRYSDKDVKKEIAGFEKHNFPIDVLGLEPGWHSKAYPCTFEWDKGRFPDPAQLSEDALNSGVRFNLWLNPYLWPDSKLDKQMKKYTGSHTVWCGNVPDYTIKDAREIMKRHFKEHQLNVGVSGFKVDEVDGYDKWVWPDVAQFPSGKDGEQMRQTYGTQFMRLTDEMYREKNERTYGLIRAANAGSVSYPYVIYNDYYSHRDFITALINSGFNGVLWTPEVRAGNSEEEWVRRMQTVCFSPMAMINAWADGTKPWSFPNVYEACQEVAFLRMQLLPYIYSTFAQYHFEGTPPFRAVNLVEGFNATLATENKKLDSTKNPYNEAIKREIKDQYMMGDNLLIAPIFSGQKKRKVVLPAGKWYDFYTGKLVGESEVIMIDAELDKIPVFVRDGGIIPMMKPIRQTKEWTNNMPLEIRVYGKAAGRFTLYDDDGKTYDFEKGAYTTKEFAVNNGKGVVKDLHKGGPWSYAKPTWKFMTK